MEEGNGKNEATGWMEGWLAHPPPTRNGPPADTRQIPTILYQLSPPPSESQARQTSKSRRPRSRGRSSQEASGRGRLARQHKYSISPTYCYSNYPLSFLPRSPRSYTRPMDGWIVDGWSIRGEWAGAGASRVTSSAAAAVRFFIVSHKMPRIPEDCKYLEVFRSGKRGRRRSSFPHGT